MIKTIIFCIFNIVIIFSSKVHFCHFQPVVHTLLFCFLLRLLDVVTTGGSIADVCGAATWWKSGNILPDEETVIGDEDSDVLEERKRVKNWDMSDKAKVSRLTYSVNECLPELPSLLFWW